MDENIVLERRFSETRPRSIPSGSIQLNQFYQTQQFPARPALRRTPTGNDNSNIYSTINFNSTPRELLRKVASPPVFFENTKKDPQMKKVLFTFLTPENQNIQRTEILTHVREETRLNPSAWEERYFELSKSLETFLAKHEFMTQQFLQLKQEMKLMQERQYQATHSTDTRPLFTPTQQPAKVQDFRKNEKIEKLMLVVEQLQAEVANKTREIARLNSRNIQVEEALYQSKRQITKLQADKKWAESAVEDEKTRSLEQETKIQKLRHEIELMEDRLAESQLTLARIRSDNSKEYEIERLKAELLQQDKRLQKMLEGKASNIEELKRYISDVETREREANRLQEKYERPYMEKKNEADSLKMIRESSVLSHENGGYISHYEQKIFELTQMVREKEEKIKKLKEENKKLDKKIGEIGDNYISQQQLDTLHKKIEHYESQILNQGGVIYDKLNNKTYDYYNGKVFEETLIYELKKDNEKLMQMVDRLRMGEKVVFTSTFPHNKSNIVLSTKMSDLALSMKSIMSDTFFKLDQVTKRFSSEEIVEESPKKTKRSGDGSPNKSKRVHSHNHSEKHKVARQLELIKIYMFDLEKYWREVMELILARERGVESTAKYREQRTREVLITSYELEKERELDYFKEENLKMSGRIDELLNMNNMMKELISKQTGSKNSNESYWKDESKRLKNENFGLEERLKKLKDLLQAEQNKRDTIEERASLVSLELERLALKAAEWEERCKKAEERLADYNRLTDEKASLSLEINSLTIRYQQQIEILQKEIAEIRRNEGKTISLQVQDLQIKLQQCEEQLRFCSQDLTACSQDLTACNQELIARNQEVEQLRRYSVEFQRLQHRIMELQAILTQTESHQQQQTSGRIDPYTLELLRSSILEIQVLNGEQALLVTNRNKELKSLLQSKFNSALAIVSQLHSSAGSSNERSESEYQELYARLQEMRASNAFGKEFSRSILLEIQALVGEVKVRREQANVRDRILGQIEKGLASLSV